MSGTAATVGGVLNIDTTKRPVRPAEWASVLDAVSNADANDEQHWIEWKSSCDFANSPTVAKHICRTILGFANRDPAQAATAVEGIGILLIGIEPGKASGVARLDNADLDQKVSPFIGTDGPIWQPHWEKYQGADVLIIEVAPPVLGDPIHCFRKTTTEIADGDIFVRHKARTVRADNREVQRLATRSAYQPSASPSLDVEIRLEGTDELCRYASSEVDLDRFLTFEKQRLIEPLRRHQRPKPQSTSALSALQAGLSMTDLASVGYDKKPEPRSAEEYEREVEDYLTNLRDAWPTAIRDVAAYLVPAPAFVVANLSNTNYRRFKVRASVAGDADVEQFDDDEDAQIPISLPSAPRSWGPIVTNYLADLVRSTAHPYLTPNFGPTVPRLSTQIERGGSFALTFPPVDLRPGETETLEDQIVLLIPATRPEPVVVEWTATATNVDAVAHGSFEVTFPAADLSASKALVDALLSEESSG